jgi:hypothetical protein
MPQDWRWPFAATRTNLDSDWIEIQAMTESLRVEWVEGPTRSPESLERP